MSFFDYTSPLNDAIASGKLDSDLFSYDQQQALEGVDLEVVDSSFYDFLGMSEKSYNLEDMLIQSKVEAVPAEYVSPHMSDYAKQTLFKKEPYTELDESELCLPSTINEASEYGSVMEFNSYDVSSPAGRSTTSSLGTHQRQSKSKSSKNVDKDSEEYRRRRTLNNIAVKKSREKAKAESRMIAQRVSALSADKDRLERRVESLSKEVHILHGLFAKMNNIPDNVRAEIARSVARLQSHPR